jgi:hypothetical protein
VLPNGDVKLTWIAPVDPGHQFFSYEVYCSAVAAGPYTLIPSPVTTYSTTTFLHVGTVANNQSLYYYVVTKYGAGGGSASDPSETLRSISLNALSASGAQDLKLTYNHLRTPPLNSSATTFTIAKQYPIGSWNTLKITDALSYPDTISVCSASIAYQVSIADNSGCVSRSNSPTSQPLTRSACFPMAIR